MMNEEEVKVRVVLQWLRDRGVRVEDLSLETTFKVKVGRQTVLVGSAAQDDKVIRPRLDILVRRGAHNLLVVEVKAETEDLTDADRDQAICYARLVHPIAPYALVTNGLIAKLFDTITREEQPSGKVRLDSEYSIQLPDESRREALRLFFDLSPNNLLALSRQQIESEIEALSGGVDDFGAVYIPDAHVPRAALPSDVRSFVASDYSTFVIVGESGVGKTCSLIDVVRSLVSSGHPTFFFRAACLEAGIIDAIAGELEWAFGGPDDSLLLLRRTSAAAGPKPLVIAVDGLDDWAMLTRVQSLAWLVQHAKSVNIRLILSCKSRCWAGYLTYRGARTNILPHIYGATTERPFSHEGLPLTPQEFYRTLDHYRAAFGVPGGFDRYALEQAQQSLFVLRLLFQVARSSHAAYLGFNSAQFFEKYLELTVAKTSNGESSRNALVALARRMFEQDREWLDETTARDALGLRVIEPFPAELLEQRILDAVGSAGERRIGFVLGHLRNYLAAFYGQSWPSKPASSFASDLEDAKPDGLRAEVAGFYYPFATADQRAAVDQNLRANAKAYLQEYLSLITTDFAALRNKFSPHTLGAVGFIAEFLLGRRSLGMYGFRPIGASDDDVLLVPVLPVTEPSHESRSLTMYHHGAIRLHWASSSNGFRSLNVVREVLLNEICPQLREMLEQGGLDETDAPVMTEELVAGIVVSSHDLSSYVTARRSPTYPISLSLLADTLRRADLRATFEEEMTRRKRAKGLIVEKWTGHFVSYSPSFNRDELEWINTRVEEVMRTGEDLPLNVRNMDRERLTKRLAEVRKYRRSLGNTISSPSLPLTTLAAQRSGPLLQLSDPQEVLQTAPRCRPR